ncbi:MAG: FG-GAP repeat protein, partial [Ignavibacteriae bacterium]|nr:FG-GAP repeat protein [Ignavibacteriota bacterium]
MKNLLTLNFITAILMLLSVISGSSQANWIINETPDTPNTPNTKDTLPEGVSEDWLNSLTDERGNRIIRTGQPDISDQTPFEDPEGDAMQRKIFTGPSASSQFGSTVSNAGDLNGDGYDDIIVGAYGYTSFTGRVYIYFGGIIMNTTPDLILTGETTSNFFGWCVSGAGDLN